MVLLLFSVPLFFAGCITYEDVEVLGIEDVRVASAGESGIILDLSIKVHNPNNYKISIVSSDLDLLINGQPAGKATLEHKIVFAKASETVQHVQIKADYVSVMGRLNSGIFSLITGSGIKVGISGHIKAKAFGLRKKIKIEASDSVNLSDFGL